MSRTVFTIDFHPVTFKAFGGKPGYWTKYDEVSKAGITEITVTPTLVGEQISNDLVCTDLNLRFDEDAFPKERFGIVYGDDQFEASVQAYMSKIFPEEEFGLPSYTEAGMQGDDYISMEYGSAFVGRLRKACKTHFRVKLHNDPAITEIDLSGLS